MRQHLGPEEQPARRDLTASKTTPVARAPDAARALQRSAGNRATARVLARWAAHPDKEKKGVMLTDAAAAELLRFNPPLNK